MTQRITKGFRALMAEAAERVDEIGPAQAQAMVERGEAVLVDVRDIRELERAGRIPGAMHAPRGMLEFWIDPESPYHRPAFLEDRAYIFACAAGWRSLLAAARAAEMGLTPVYSMAGGYGGWLEAELPTE